MNAAPPSIASTVSPSVNAPAVAPARDAGRTAPAARSPSSQPSPTENTASPVAAAVKSGAIKGPAAEPVKNENTARATPKPSSAPLNLSSLEQRLKDTDAIGVLTKISLKNQVDDLLDQFRAYYEGRIKTTLAELRRPFDRLVLKVLSLLQDSDPQLASAIVASREALWGILSDRAKFEAI